METNFWLIMSIGWFIICLAAWGFSEACELLRDFRNNQKEKTCEKR